MFGGKEHTVTAIRRNDDSIDYYHFKKYKTDVTKAEENSICTRRCCAD